MRAAADAEEQEPNEHDPDLEHHMKPVALFHDAPKSGIAYANEQNLANDNKQKNTKLGMHDGSLHTIPLHQFFKVQYRDEDTNELLPRAWVEEAMHEELE